MCSWCWGFQPVIRDLGEMGYPITVALGMLGADRACPMRADDKVKMSEHWNRVLEQTGQPFDFGFFEREGFVYDTEPPSRALGVVRARFPMLSAPFLGRLQELFYALGQDITETSVLRDAAAEFGIASDGFEEAFLAPSVAAEIAAEWRQTARLGVSGYPTLLAFLAGKPHVVTIGWRRTEEVLSAVEAIVTESATAAT